ncbi:MAG: hypothetical protein ACK481_02770 [Candidatus Melainabacteria bacterium]|jgi:hypothetical protein
MDLEERIVKIEDEPSNEEKENKEFKKALKIFGGINLILFLLFLWITLDSHSNLINATIQFQFIQLFIQIVYLIPTIIFCLVKKKYAFMKGASIVLGITMLLFPVTCFGTLFVKFHQVM